VISDSVSTIGSDAFAYCSRLGSLTIPGNVHAITTLALADCSGVTNIVLLSGVTSLGSFAIANCSNLTTVVIPDTLRSIDIYAFQNCPNLKALFFRGDAPSVPQTAFSGTMNAIAFYLPGKAGWAGTFGGGPTALWLPVVRTQDWNFGVRSNEFGFNVSWANGQTAVVEASSDLAGAAWVPISTNVLSGDSLYVRDLFWTNISQRLYRIRSP